jgi:hypothetical protein
MDPDALKGELLDDVEAKTLALAEAVQRFLDDAVGPRAGRTAAEAKIATKVATNTTTLAAVMLTDPDADDSPEPLSAITESAVTTPHVETQAATVAAEARATLDRLLRLPAEVPASLAPIITALNADDTGLALWGGLYGWLMVRALGQMNDGVPGQGRSWIDEWLLGRLINEALQGAGVREMRAAQAVTAVKLATGQDALFTGAGRERAIDLLEALLADPDAQQLINVNAFQGVVWFNQEGFEALAQWLVMLAQVQPEAEAATVPDADTPAMAADAVATEPSALSARYEAIAALWNASQTAGYQIDKLRARVRGTLTLSAVT